ncbi:MAG: SDR family NAD(P)-dependent oxidoreductase [Myxococcota bacterium]|nr:SDR family NAD(P)-dependent oxidoreductase [Myxococcota bacterium]
MESWTPLSTEGETRAIVIGARRGLGRALADHILRLNPLNRVLATSRDPAWASAAVDPRETRACLDVTNEADFEALAARVPAWSTPNCILYAAGVLHDGPVQPERRWTHLSQGNMGHIFSVNTFGVGLTLRYLVEGLPRREPGVFGAISARVGSIGDNRLGGWYSYRASKAALNMLIKTASLEAARSHPQLICVALHPGTVTTNLSAPFTKRADPAKLFSPEYSASRLVAVIQGLSPAESGQCFAWDGQVIPW